MLLINVHNDIHQSRQCGVHRSLLFPEKSSGANTCSGVVDPL